MSRLHPRPANDHAAHIAEHMEAGFGSHFHRRDRSQHDRLNPAPLRSDEHFKGIS